MGKTVNSEYRFQSRKRQGSLDLHRNSSNSCYEKEIRHDLRPKCCQPVPPRVYDTKEVVIVNDMDGPRELIVPSNKPNLYHAVIDSQEFQRLKEQSKVKSFQEIMAERDEEESRRASLIEASRIRKEKAKEMVYRKQKGMKLTQIEIDAQKRAQYTLQRANELRQEQQDEVKEANSIILETKCYAIRDAQLQEKELIRREREAEEKRLDEMMEERRRWAIKEEIRRKDEDRARRQNFLKGLIHQIEENKLSNVLLREKIAEDARLMDETLVQMQLDELDNQKSKEEEKTLFRKQLLAINDQMRREKEEKQHQEKLLEMRIREFMKKKQERDDAWDEEQMMLKKAKEKEINRLYTLQKSAQERQGEADELQALRARDAVEKEWRDREKAEAKRRMEETEELHRERQKQIRDRQRMEAVQVERDKRDFEKILNYQRDLSDKLNKEELKRKKENEKARCEILSQINAKEYERIEQRRTLFEDGLTLEQDNIKRDREMAEVMINKIQNLRSYKMPEKYVKDLEKKLKLEQYIEDMERIKRGGGANDGTDKKQEESKTTQQKEKPYERLARMVKEKAEKVKNQMNQATEECFPQTCKAEPGKPETCPAEIKKEQRMKSSQSAKSKLSKSSKASSKVSSSNKSDAVTKEKHSASKCQRVQSSKHNK